MDLWDASFALLKHLVVLAEVCEVPLDPKLVVCRAPLQVEKDLVEPLPLLLLELGEGPAVFQLHTLMLRGELQIEALRNSPIRVLNYSGCRVEGHYGLASLGLRVRLWLGLNSSESLSTFRMLCCLLGVSRS